jgi:large subunit ribosomal protein L10
MKEIMIRDYKQRIGDIDDAMLISLRGVSANDNNEFRQALVGKDIHVTVIRNKLFMQAYGDSSLAGLSPLLVGSNAIAYGAESVVEVAREIVALLDKFPGIELRGAVLDGQLFEGDDGVKALSKFPTRDEAIAQDVTLILGPGRKLLASVKGPGNRLAGIVKAIEDRLEKGEAIAKV